VRPTYLLDPEISIRPTENQIADAIKEIGKRKKVGQRTLCLTITKKLAEAMADHLKSKKISAEYLHSEIKTLARPKILADLRKGKFDVLVGINLLREGLDLPEVSLIIIFDADKEGFLSRPNFAGADNGTRQPPSARQGDYVCRRHHRINGARD